MNGLTTGTVAGRAGVNVETMRYYERRGLLPQPPRTLSNYRLYTDETVRRVRFIKRAQALGFILSEIKELLALRVDSTTSCGEVKRRTGEKIADIERKIHSLREMKKALEKLTAACRGKGPTAECPILDALGKPDRTPTSETSGTRRNGGGG